MQNKFNISIFVPELRNFMKKTLIYLLSVFLLIGGESLRTSAKSFYFQKKEDSRINLVVIDPGHGGKDPGAVNGNSCEKDISLDIALKLGNYITSNFPETKVIYTRTKDIFVPLHQRANIANKNGADLFISIHVNFENSKSVQGTETFVLGVEDYRSKANLEVAKKENSVILLEDDYSTTYQGFDNSPESYIMFETVQQEYTEQSLILASSIQNQFREGAQRKDRSVKMAGFLVLWQTTMPSVLIETGFISHPQERNYLTSEAGKTKLASAIFDAFKDYKKKIEAKSSFNLITEKPPVITEAKIFTNEENVRPPLQEAANEGIYFSVQIAALKTIIDIKPENFMGETSIFKLNSGNIYRYFSGRFDDYNKAVKEKARLENKFGDAFVVAIEDGELISVKKAMRKM